MAISDIIEPRTEVRDGEFQGVLQAHKVDASTDRLENDPRRLLSMTYPSNAFETALGYVADKLAHNDNQGAITLNGPYGSGKSHGLLALYHLFDRPDIGQDWIDRWDIEIDMPKDADVTVLSTSETDADRIWEPIFQDLGATEILEDVKRYPTVEHIEQLAGDHPVAIFFDEIETWWGSFDRDEDGELVEQNEFFLQNLLEVAEDPDTELFTFITLLDKNDDIKRILNRTKPYSVDLNDSGDRERVILHRLFETPPDGIDEDAVRTVVREYIDGYVPPIEIPEEKRYENRMVETYPFHPELLDLLDDLYEAAEGRQNTRGAMGVLADTIEDVCDDTNLIVVSDIDARPFRGFNQVLYDRFVSDRDEVDDIEFGDALLKTILLYTINDRAKEASINECLLGTFKPSMTSISRLDMSLRSLYGTAHYLDRDTEDGPYYLTEDPKLSALVTREQERILGDDPDAAEDKLAEVVRDDVWGGGSNVYIHERDEVPNDTDISVVVRLDYESTDTLEPILSEFLDDLTYPNTILFVTPSKEVLGDETILRKTARVLGAENLRGKVDDDTDELGRIIRDERRELRNELESRYGQWVKWTQDSSGELRMRRLSVSANVDDVRSKVGHDKTYIGETIEDEAEDAKNGIRVELMLKDFKQFRKMPVVLDDSTFYSAVRKLHRDGKIILEGDRSNYYVAEKGQYPTEITDDLTIYHPDQVPEYVFEEEEEETEGGETGTGVTTPEGGTGEVGGGTPTGGGTVTTTGGTGETGGGSEVIATTIESIDLSGNKARVLRSQAESRLNAETDTIRSLTIDYGDGGLTKAEVLSLIGALTDAAQIDVDMTVERVDED